MTNYITSNPLFSIIIPTYNVQSYIAKCLQSCINQSLSDIEILVIDDCGQDNSISIAKEFAKKDCRIKIIHNEKNLGLFKTRLQGEKEAKGLYILPLDADDYLETNTCKILYKILIKSHTQAINNTDFIPNPQIVIRGGQYE